MKITTLYKCVPPVMYCYYIVNLLKLYGICVKRVFYCLELCVNNNYNQSIFKERTQKQTVIFIYIGTSEYKNFNFKLVIFPPFQINTSIIY